MDTPADLGRAQLRVVRPSDDLEPIVRFYRDGLGFEVSARLRMIGRLVSGWRFR